MMEASAQEKQRIGSVLAEYLAQEGYEATLGDFRSECATRGEELDERVNGGGHSLEMAELMECFELGEREAFFVLWDREVPAQLRSQDPTCLNVEFNLSLYFAVHCYRHGQEHKAEAERQAFKTYLETRGSALAQTEEFVAFYALPYVPDPTVHPSFKLLFSDSWTSELTQRLRDFLGNVLTSKDQAKVPRLVQMYRECDGGKPSSSVQGVESVKLELANAHQKYAKVANKLKEITHSYHSLVGISTEMVMALETAVKEKMISPEFLTSMCAKLFGGGAAQSLDISRPGTATSLLRASIALPPPTPRGGVPLTSDTPLLPSLNFARVKQDLQSLSNSDKAAILQALRWRLTKALPGEQRETAVEAYLHHDLLGFTSNNGNYRDFVLRLVQSSDELVAEQMSRLLNTLSSLKTGRVYVAGCPQVLSALIQQLRTQNFVDGPIQRNIVGALQKLSLRRSCQSAMIGLSLVDWLVQVLAEHTPTISEYSFHYSLALLMNLALRNKGRLSCLQHSSPLLRLLGDLLEHEDQEVRSYVHGILYSILSLEHVREEARGMGMEAMLRSALQSSPPDLISQLNYILEQLNCDTPGDMSASDADDDEDDDGEDDEEEDDPDVIDGDEGEVDPLVHSGGLSGEMLLSNRYLGVMTSATLPASKLVQRVKEDPPDSSAPLSRPITPLTFGNKMAAPPPAKVQPNGSREQLPQHMQAFMARPKIPRTPDGPAPVVQRQDPPPPTPSQSPPTASQRPHTRSGRGSKQTA